jgi:ribosome-binding factor A
MSRRTERVGEQLQAELARLLRAEATDPRVRLVTLTRVDLSPDFARADVYWSTLPGKGAPSVEEAEAGLASAAGFLRRRLAQEISLRRTPELHFRHDPSLALGDEALSILRQLRDDETTSS